MYSNQPQFVEKAWSEGCSVDCSSCTTFPAPFRRINEASYCRFTQIDYNPGDEILFSGDRLIRMLFVLDGAIQLTMGEEAKVISPKQFACLQRGERFEALVLTKARLVVLSLDYSLELCESDIFGSRNAATSRRKATDMRKEAAPSLAMHAAIEQLITGIFLVPTLSACARYHKMKASELFMTINTVYSRDERSMLFSSMILPEDNFKVFILNNYERADNVTELADMAGMSLSVFKRRFAYYFDDSVYHWMMVRKAERIHADILGGEESTRNLMNKYKFSHYTQFSRFCKNYLRMTPAQLIAQVHNIESHGPGRPRRRL